MPGEHISHLYDMQKRLVKMLMVACVSSLMLTSCGGPKNLLIPHAVSTAPVSTIHDLGLKPGEFDILKTITETASVRCEYNGSLIKITAGDGDFSYKFMFDSKRGWELVNFNGAAELGYFSADLTEVETSAPRPEEFSRRVAMSRIIKAVTDYGADGIVEPIVTTVSNNMGDRTVEYTSTIRAKLVVVKPTGK